jgi:hypothetical protein
MRVSLEWEFALLPGAFDHPGKTGEYKGKLHSGHERRENKFP